MRRNLLVATLLFALSAGGLSLLLHPAPTLAADDPDPGGSRIRIGLSIAPVHLNLKGHNIALVGLGSYIVNAQGGCNDCHSCPTYAPGHNPYPPPLGVSGDGKLNGDNHLAGGVPFDLPPPFGTIHSPNLTPDSTGKPAGLTLDQFVEAIRTGHDPDDPQETLVVMPWPLFRYMTDLDLRAIYEYLSAIPPAQPGSCFAPGQ